MTRHLTGHRGGFGPGLTQITRFDEPEDDTGIAVSVLKLAPGESREIETANETAWLLMSGTAEVTVDNRSVRFSRASLFDKSASAVHVAAGARVRLSAETEAEFTVYETKNAKPFPSRVFGPADVPNEHRGKGQVDDACYRYVRTIFDLRNSDPNAELVLGEVVTFPGRWSSYPPHHHPQPEIYHYRFTDPRGYGHAELGETVLKVRANDTIKIFDGFDHAQCAAPGYGMYYAWVIRHLAGNPYTVPEFTEEHRWTMDAKAEFWRPEESRAMAEPTLDVICIGRSSVDLYGEQVGGRLEDMASFAKYVGGCPTNISVGGARLGLRTALLTRVGDEHMGRFIREQLAAEGVDTSHVIADKQRLTALVILGIRDRHTFPLIFYREDCADMALTEDDIDEAFIASAKAVVVTGTHFSTPSVAAMSRKAMRLARAHGRKVALDIDYRPVLWALTGHGLGEERFVESSAVSAHLQAILPECDLIVGTEEEIHIAGGATDTLAALRRVRELSTATIVVKRGPMGCVVFPGAIPDDIEQGVKGPGFPVEVYNVLGAGDGFMAGFLRGWLRDEPVEAACRYANACGAFAVSRHGCAPSYPSWAELSQFLAEGSAHHRLREDPALNQVHWATTRIRDWPEVHAMAFDHRSQLEEMVARHGVDPERIGAFKLLAWQAAKQAHGDRPGFGVLIDGRLGSEALFAAAGTGAWIGRPIELPGSRPLRFEGGPDVGVTLREWPLEHVVKCLVQYHPDDPPEIQAEQDRQLLALFDASRATRHELLIEVIPPKSMPADDRTVARALDHLYGIGIHPDWWKLPPPPSEAAWAAIQEVIARRDPHCRGVLLLGLEAPEEELMAAFTLAARQPWCRGFAVGRTIFGRAAEDWIAGRIDDDEAVRRMAASYGSLIAAWENARAAAQAAA